MTGEPVQSWRLWRVDEQVVGPELVLSMKRERDRAVVTIRGELDAYSAPGLDEQIARLLRDNSKVVVVMCPPGKQALGGGAEVGGPDVVALSETDFYLDADGNRVGWMARANETQPTGVAWILVVHALCAALAS